MRNVDQSLWTKTAAVVESLSDPDRLRCWGNVVGDGDDDDDKDDSDLVSG